MNPFAFFGLLPLHTWLLLAAFIVPISSCQMQTVRLDRERAARVAEQTATRLAAAQETAAALAVSEANAAKSSAWSHQLKESQDAYNAVQTQLKNVVAAYADRAAASLADNGRLRDNIATYARGSGTAADTAAAASERAAALGVLLAEALRLDDQALLAGAESAGAAESNGNAVRALLAAWPR